MMSQRFNLFYAGFTASLPTLYFNKQKIKETFLPHHDREIQIVLENYFNTFEEDKEEQLSHLVSALALAKHFDISEFETPRSFSDYFQWHEDLINEFENRFPMGRIEHYYFLYARRIAELIKNMGLIKVYLDIQILCKQNPDMSQKIENCITDSEYIIFKLMAPAALLSSEPRHSCFNNFFKQMSDEIKLFKGVNIQGAEDEVLLKLKSDADNFSVLLMNGFKKCVGVLKEL